MRRSFSSLPQASLRQSVSMQLLRAFISSYLAGKPSALRFSTPRQSVEPYRETAGRISLRSISIRVLASMEMVAV